MPFNKSYFLLLSSVVIPSMSVSVAAPNVNAGLNPQHERIVQHWDRARREAAIPRDFVIDARGQAYMRVKHSELIPYGHMIQPLAGKPNGGSDSEAPFIDDMSPIGGDHSTIITFNATVTDNIAVKQVDFFITESAPGSITENFTANADSSDNWTTTLQGFTDGGWCWYVVAKDTAKRGGNTSTSDSECFTVSVGGSTVEPPPTNSDTVINKDWTQGGDVQQAAGRIYFEMPSNSKRKGPWNGYVCSGTVVTDNDANRSLILTAAHCVYDDANKAFARNVLFIPNQHDTTGSATDRDCSNDPIGCWSTAFGIVDSNWAGGTFPNNKEWDHAYYVVHDTGAHHSGLTDSSDKLDEAVTAMTIQFETPNFNDYDPSKYSSDFSYALGYSYSDDPYFMYCAEDMTTEGEVNWWLPSCGLSGGASGGPWLQSVDEVMGTGVVISVNSWGYTTSPGMAGPKLNNDAGKCLYNKIGSSLEPSSLSDGDAGIIIISSSCP